MNLWHFCMPGFIWIGYHRSNYYITCNRLAEVEYQGKLSFSRWSWPWHTDKSRSWSWLIEGPDWRIPARRQTWVFPPQLSCYWIMTSHIDDCQQQPAKPVDSSLPKSIFSTLDLIFTLRMTGTDPWRPSIHLVSSIFDTYPSTYPCRGGHSLFLINSSIPNRFPRVVIKSESILRFLSIHFIHFIHFIIHRWWSSNSVLWCAT